MEERKYRTLADGIGLAPDQRVLEVGCGWGALLNSSPEPMVRASRPWPSAVSSTTMPTAGRHVFNGAAALGFYLTLAIFPAFIVLMTVIPYLPIQDIGQAIKDLLEQALPEESAAMVEGIVAEVTQEQRGGLLSFGLLATLWAASSGMYAVMQQLNITYDVKEERNFIVARATAVILSIAFGVLIIGAFSLIVLGGGIAPFSWKELGIDVRGRSSTLKVNYRTSHQIRTAAEAGGVLVSKAQSIKTWTTPTRPTFWRDRLKSVVQPLASLRRFSKAWIICQKSCSSVPRDSPGTKPMRRLNAAAAARALGSSYRVRTNSAISKGSTPSAVMLPMNNLIKMKIKLSCGCARNCAWHERDATVQKTSAFSPRRRHPVRSPRLPNFEN